MFLMQCHGRQSREKRENDVGQGSIGCGTEEVARSGHIANTVTRLTGFPDRISCEHAAGGAPDRVFYEFKQLH